MVLSYIVSTAGHAQHQNELYPHNIKSILQLIQEGAEEFKDEKVVGFTSLLAQNGNWICNRYSFPELLALSTDISLCLRETGVQLAGSDNHIISLLCPTGLDFLVTWIALMRMGYGVVFIAPQCSPSAINHLLKSTASTRLIYHSKYSDLAQSANQIDCTTVIVELSPMSECCPSSIKSDTMPEKKVNPLQTSHIFHTSGTSGTPKPIPNTHGQSVSVLPRRSLPSYMRRPTDRSVTDAGSPSEACAFTTTPLFHGGVSDLLRAWMARSAICFFPTSDVPITSANVVRAVEACDIPLPPLSTHNLTEDQTNERIKRFSINSFLSVPYILSVLAEEDKGPAVSMLKKMDFVSTGGAPLDSTVGNNLVRNGVKLVSRLGSSECGFLLSSHRDYDVDDDWEWLRNDSPYADALAFEPTPDDTQKFEMVVTNRWTSKTKSNRDDDSYATGDLYTPHPTKQSVWRYVGRGDDVIVMSNGEKASPGPIETTFRSSPLLSDSLVVGSDRSQLGALLFLRSATDASNVRPAIQSLLDAANSSSPSFAQISIDMCELITDTAKAQLLPKSSKGTIQRGVAYEVFKKDIDNLYKGSLGQTSILRKRSHSEITMYLRKRIAEICASRLRTDFLEETTDLFAWGVDSLMATRIRTDIQKNLDTGNQSLPNNVVFEKPSIERLSQYIFDLQEKKDVSFGPNSALQLMDDLVAKYGKFSNIDVKPAHASLARTDAGRTILLTGGTGSLGAFLIRQFLHQPASIVKEVVCLVRAEDDEAAQKRINHVLRHRGMTNGVSRLKVFAADLSNATLGLTKEVYARLATTVDCIIHAAWPVHFASSLVSFESNIRGTRNLLDLLAQAYSNGGSFYYCSSLASVLAQSSSSIKEIPSDDPSTASPIGYSQSKWVTEKICRLANESEPLRNRVHILRVGQLCGDTHDGHWNEKEGWPLMIRTAQTTGCMPTLNENPSWLPVDVAAAAIVEVVLQGHDKTQMVYHIAHPANLDWTVLLDGLHVAGLEFKRETPVAWLEQVEATSEDVEKNPSRQMLSMWQGAYGLGTVMAPQATVDTTHAQAASISLRNAAPIGSEQIERMVRAWQRTGFLQ